MGSVVASRSAADGDDDDPCTKSFISRLDSNRILVSELGSYLQVSRIGRGAFAVVYEAVRFPSGDPVALKCPYPRSCTIRPTSLAGEVETVRSLNGLEWNVDLVDYFYHGEFECAAFHLGGDSMEAYLSADPPVCDRLAVADRMIDIVDDLHKRNVAHMDLHTGNWLIMNPHDLTTVKLIDFGRAKRNASESQIAVDLNRLRGMVFDLLNYGCSWHEVTSTPCSLETPPASPESAYAAPSIETIHLLVSALKATKCDAHPVDTEHSHYLIPS